MSFRFSVAPARRAGRLMAALALVALGISAQATTYNVPGDFATVQAALAGATVSGDVLNFTANVNETAVITLTKAYTINLNGFTWSNSATGNGFVVSATPTIINGAGGVMQGSTNNLLAVNDTFHTTVTNTVINGNSTALRAVNSNNVRLVMDGCTIQNALRVGVRLNSVDGQITLNNCTVQNNGTVAGLTTDNDRGQIVLNAATGTGLASITLNNTTINRGTSVYPAVNGGTAGVAVNTFSMTGGSITGGGATAQAVINDAAGGIVPNINLTNVTISNPTEGPTINLTESNLVASGCTIPMATVVGGGSGSAIGVTGTGNSVSLTNCDLSGGTAAFAFTPVINMAGGNTTWTINNCDLRGPGTGNRLNMFTSGAVNVTGGTIARQGTNNATLLTGAGTGTVTFTGCTMESGNTNGAIGGTPGHIIINNPTFSGGLGAIALYQDGGGTITLNGASAASKVNLDPAIAGGTILFTRVGDGTVEINDAVITQKPAAGFYNSADVPFTTTARLTLNRFDAQNGAGALFVGDNQNSAGSVAITATNSIFEGPSDNQAMISSQFSNHTGGTLITLNHCTIYGQGAANVLVNGDGAGDTLVGNYSIFDDRNTAAASGTIALTGTGNIVTLAGSVGSGGFLPGQPGDTLNLTLAQANLIPGGLELSATGRIGNESFAGAKATGSALAVDIDGNVRPNGGTAPDAGASESSAVPVELSGFEVQ